MPSDNESLSGSKTAMIVVDMQNAFLSDEGSMNKGGMDITELKKTVSPVRKLIDACRSAAVPIIFTRYVLRADYKGTWDSELDPLMDQRLEDYVLDKTRYRSFYNTSLEVILRGLGVDTLIICGVTTEICVESTIRDAYFRDFKILVPKDAVAAMDIDRHKGTLATIEYGFGSVTTSAKLINDLLGIAARL